MITVQHELAMRQFGERLGKLLAGGEVIELVGDVGAGKTTLVRGLAVGMGVDETVQSPSFTISRVYDAADSKRLVHYDFYRLSDPGIMGSELDEAIREKDNIVVIEWADAVEYILPNDRLTLTISAPSEAERHIYMHAGGEMSQKLMEKLT
jgi:tRNA threonylcarbamoyladenosine biosynthesis protein TsaE